MRVKWEVESHFFDQSSKGGMCFVPAPLIKKDGSIDEYSRELRHEKELTPFEYTENTLEREKTLCNLMVELFHKMTEHTLSHSEIEQMIAIINPQD